MGFGTFVQSKLIIKKIDDDSFNFMAEEKEIETQKKKESAKYDKAKSKISALKTAFKKLDSDSSAKLEENEFVRLAVEQLGCDNDSAVKLFKKIDVSGNETVSFAEFDSWLKSGGDASVNKLLTFAEEDEKKDMDESEVKIVSMELYLVTIPLSHPYICGDLTFENQSNVVCKIETNAGIFGFGESNPDEGFTEETPESIWKITESEIFPLIHNKNALDIENISAILDANIDHSNVMATGMINMALWDIYGKFYKKPVYQCLVDLSDGKEQEVCNEKIPLLYPVSDQTIDKDTEVLQEKINEGYKTFMLKMGANQDISYQIERIKNIEKVFGPIGTNVFIVTDANEGYSFEQSMEFIKGCAGIKLSFIEQPIKKTEHENLKILCQECLKYGFDLSLDESVQDIDAINYCEAQSYNLMFA